VYSEKRLLWPYPASTLTLKISGANNPHHIDQGTKPSVAEILLLSQGQHEILMADSISISLFAHHPITVIPKFLGGNV